MPLRRAFRWFSEICGVLLGCGLIYCIVEIQRINQRIDGLQKTFVVQQNNNQTVIVESDAKQLAREILINKGKLPSDTRTTSNVPDVSNGASPTDGR